MEVEGSLESFWLFILSQSCSYEGTVLEAEIMLSYVHVCD